MTAAMLVLEPIFGADLPPAQYAYRPGRNAQQAVQERLHRRQKDVVDADLADYFGSIPHRELMRSLGRRIVDTACAASNSDMAGMRCRGDGPEKRQNTDNCCSGQWPRHPSGFTDFFDVVELVYAAIHAGLEEAG